MSNSQASEVVDVLAPCPDLSWYWFLGANASQTVIGYFVDKDGRRTGNSFSLNINQQNGTNLPLNLASVTGGIPVDSVAPIQTAKVVTNATNASPSVLTVNGHGYVNGQQVTVAGATGNTAINGIYYAGAVTTNTFDLYLERACINAVAGNGLYASSTATVIGEPVPGRAAAGAIVKFSGPTYIDFSQGPSADFAANTTNYSSSDAGEVPLGRVNAAVDVGGVAAATAVIQPYQAVPTEATPTVTNATSFPLLVANANRRYLLIQNNSAANIMFSLSGLVLTGIVPTSTNIGEVLAPGQAWENPAHFCSTSLITVYQTSGGNTNLISVVSA